MIDLFLFIVIGIPLICWGLYIGGGILVAILELFFGAFFEKPQPPKSPGLILPGQRHEYRDVPIDEIKYQY